MYRCTIVQIHPPLNALGSKGSEVTLYTTLYTGQRAYLTDLRFPGVSLAVNTVRAYGFHRFFADLRRDGTTINSIKLSRSQLPNGRLKIGRSAFHMHPQLVKLEMGLLT